MPELYKNARITQILIIINIAVFLLETAAGGSENTQTAVSFGALAVPLVLNSGEWYRVFTSMFLHFGAEHLCSNMISLFALGPYVERIYGKGRYIVIYLFSGICGNLFSLAVDLFTGSVNLSAGASGAICGLLGAFICLAAVKSFRKLFPIRNIGLALLCCLAPGIANHSVNLSAHIGGLIGGVISAGIFLIFMKLRRR